MESNKDNYNYGLATRAIHIGQSPDQWSSMSVIPPITLSTTFKQDSPAEPKLYDYGRSGNPSRNVLETCLAGIEEANYTLVFASGLGAITTIIGLLQVNDHIICCDDVYGGTGRLFRNVFTKSGIKISFVDAIDSRNVENKITERTKIVWIETPTNPLLKIIDIKKMSTICKQHGIILVVDNTFLTPCFQKPLQLGADLVVYSLTKYMNGHCDVVMGSITMNDELLFQKLKTLQNSMGIVPSPFDCQMVNRGLKTLQIRMKQHMESGFKIAQYLEKHDKILKVIHPLLKSHEQHELCLQQSIGHSGILSVYLKCDYEKTKLFIQNLKLFTLAESLGGFESLIEIPSLMTHASVPEELRQHLNITDNLVRISVGLEDSDDLINDLDQALKSI